MRARHLIVPVLVGSLISVFLHIAGNLCLQQLLKLALRPNAWLWTFYLTCDLLVPALGGTLVAVLLYARKRAKDARENETLCRRCKYILRGITEPRCPECGEVI